MVRIEQARKIISTQSRKALANNYAMICTL